MMVLLRNTIFHAFKLILIHNIYTDISKKNLFDEEKILPNVAEEGTIQNK